MKLDLGGDCLFKPLMLCVSGSYLAIGSDTGAWAYAVQCDDTKLSCNSMHLNSFSSLWPLGWGCLQWHCPYETLPSHTNHSLTKTRKSLQHGFPLPFLHQLGSGKSQTRWWRTQARSTPSWFLKEVAGLHPLIVLRLKQDHKLSIIQWKKTTAVTAQSSHPSNAICCCTKMTTEACTPEVKLNTLAGLNARANYRRSHCKTSTMDAHLVTRWAQTTTNPYFQLIAKSWLVICRSLSRRSDFLNNKQRNVLENFLEFDILSWWAEPIPRKNRGSSQLGHLTQTPEVRDAGGDREVRKHY